MTKNRVLKIATASALVVLALGIGLYALILWEGSSARGERRAMAAALHRTRRFQSDEKSARCRLGKCRARGGACGLYPEVRDLLCLRRRRQDRNRERCVSAATEPAQRRRPAHERWGIVLPLEERD